MLTDLIKYYLFDRLDRQILNRIPYAVLPALVIYFSSSFFVQAEWLRQWPYDLVMISSFAFFVIHNFLFNFHVNKYISAGLLENANLKETTRKIRSIFEGKSSVLDDLDLAKARSITALGVIAGISFTLFLMSLTLVVLNNFQDANLRNYAGIGILILSAFIYFDLNRNPSSDREQTTKGEFISDIFETYTVKNSSKRIHQPQASLQLIGRIIGPLISLQVPKYACQSLLVYENAHLMSMITELSQRNDGLHLKHTEGWSPKGLLTNSGRIEKITTLVENSQMENFPYLLDPEYAYSPEDGKRWASFNLIERSGNEERIVSKVFVHKFRSLILRKYVKENGRQEGMKTIADKKHAYLFILIGERNYVQYMLSKIELQSTVVHSSLLQFDPDSV